MEKANFFEEHKFLVKKNINLEMSGKMPIFVEDKNNKDMNVFQYAAIVEQNWKLNLGDMSGYTPKYTFYNDFAIAEFCEVYMRDKNAVKKTYNQVIKSWGNNIKALTEIVMVLNHKSWAFAENVDSKYLGVGENWREFYANLYTELYEKAVDFVYKKFSKNEEAMRYYYEVTD